MGGGNGGCEGGEGGDSGGGGGSGGGGDGGGGGEGGGGALGGTGACGGAGGEGGVLGGAGGEGGEGGGGRGGGGKGGEGGGGGGGLATCLSYSTAAWMSKKLMTTLRRSVMSPGRSRPRLVGRRVSRTLVSSAGATAPVGTTVVADLRTSGLRSTRCVVAYAGRMWERG
jgi:hypothetical protein